MRQVVLPLAVVGFVVVGVLVYSRITQPLLARSEAARMVCDTRVLPALLEANAIVEHARKSPDAKRLPNLVEEGKQLKERLVELTQIVEERARGGGVGARALRTVAKLDTPNESRFIENAADQALRRCPDKLHDRAKVLDAVRAIVLVLKRGSN